VILPECVTAAPSAAVLGVFGGCGRSHSCRLWLCSETHHDLRQCYGLPKVFTLQQLHHKQTMREPVQAPAAASTPQMMHVLSVRSIDMDRSEALQV
jgi:hypothetical protein